MSEMDHRWSKADPSLTPARAAAVAALLGDVSQHEQRHLSLARGLRYLAGMTDDPGLEGEISGAIGQRLGRSSSGLFFPTSFGPLRPRADGLDTFTTGKGATTVATEVRDLIELLRNKMRVIQLGATLLRGLNANVSFPVQLTGSSLTWVSENPGSDVAESDATFGVTTLTPHMCSATTSFSRKLLAQSSIDVEGFVRNDIAMAHAVGLDYAAIQGSGAGSIPLGLLGTPNIGDVADSGGNGSVPDLDDIVALETQISVANSDATNMRFLTTPQMRGLLKSKEIFAGTSGVPIWQNSGQPGIGNVNGYDAYASAQVPSTKTVGTSSEKCHALILGDWSNLLIGDWGVLEIIVDPYAKKKSGMVEATSYAMADFCVKQPSAFSAKQDAILS